MRSIAAPRARWFSATLAILLLPFASALAGPVSEAVGHGGERVNPLETLLIDSLQKIQTEQLDGAIEKIRDVVQNNPKFKLAQLIYGDMLLAKAGPIRDIGSGLTNAAPAEMVAGLRDEAHMRWQHYRAHPRDGVIPDAVLEIDPEIRHLVLVDAGKSRLYVLENDGGGMPRLVADYYVSIGKNGTVKAREGDKRTPLGVYMVNDFLPSAGLPDLYGTSGAFPLDYPNIWDRRHGKTGHGIWLHGTPSETYSRQPRASDGCITLSNDDLERMKPYLKVGQTPVIIAQSLSWADSAQVTVERQSFREVIDAWRHDWSSGDVERYLQHYSPDFSNGRMDYTGWSRYKKQVSAGKSFIDVQVSKLSVFNYPERPDLRVVTFEQNYKSNNHSEISLKQQYWQRSDDGTWRIVYEGPAS